MAEHCPLKRCAVPEDVARVVAFLASEDGSWVNGEPSTIIQHSRTSLTKFSGQVITISGGSSQ